jgi:hypothetical protein
MNYTKKEISCPECKQITSIPENPGKSLPKNRGLLNLIIYNEEVNKGMRDQIKIDFSQKKSLSENEKLLSNYEAALSKIEETYNKILADHPFLNEISDILLKKEVDDTLDIIIHAVNNYRESLHKKIESEFSKVNLIKSFKQSIYSYKMKFGEIVQKFTSKGNSCSANNETLDNISNFNTNVTNLMIEEESSQNTNEIQGKFGKDLGNLKNEIEFIELYNITLKNYNKEIYNPCKFFFQNKFQNDKLYEDVM